jgi:hypothetical protein
MGMVGGSVLGEEGRRSAEGYAPYLGVGYCREGGLLGEMCFEGLPRGVRGDAFACRGHPYMFLHFAKLNNGAYRETSTTRVEVPNFSAKIVLFSKQYEKF